jgi:sugar/nucleoside kinase (ribokinase family)
MDIDCLSVGILVADHGCAPIDHVPAAGELILADELPLSIGGCASNAAVDLARVGVRVAVIGCVGRDVFGRYIIEALVEAGVDTTSVRALAGVGTSGTLIVNVCGEDRRFIHTVGANARFAAADIDPNRLRAAKILYVGGYLLSSCPTSWPKCSAKRGGGA